MKCEICNLEVKSFLSLGKHLVVHDITLQEYYDKYLEGKKVCENCGNNVPFSSLSYGYQKFCCLDCAYKFRLGKKPVYKEKILKSVECKICGTFVVSIKALSQHLRFRNVSSQEYYDKYILKDYESGKESEDTLMKDGAENFVPADKSKLASKKYYGFGKDFNDWKGPDIEFFRDKMKKKYPEFKK